MKKQVLTFSLILLLSGFSFGQLTNYDFTFEPGTTQGFWNYFENGSNTTGVTFEANPVPGGVNSSATVGKFTAASDGGEWAGCESLYGTLGKWRFDGSNPTTVTIDVYKTTFTPVWLKFTSTNPAGQGTVFIGSQIPSAINEWVTLTYIVDFSTTGGENNADNNAGTNQVVLHVDQAPRTEDHIVYFDNLKFTATKLADPILPPDPITPPTVHAPTPPARIPADVVSIYSGQYADLAGTEIGKNWGEATIASDIIVEGDTTKQLLQFNYQGIVLSSPINLVGFEKIHIDFFQTDQAQIKLSIINVGGGDITKLLVVANPGWNSFDIALTEFVGLNLATVHQLKLEGAPTQGNTTVFFDNLYFYKGEILGNKTFKDSKINMYPNPVKNSLTIEANNYITKVAVFNSFGQEVLSVIPDRYSTTLQTNNLANGIYIVKATIDGKVATSKFVKK